MSGCSAPLRATSETNICKAQVPRLKQTPVAQPEPGRLEAGLHGRHGAVRRQQTAQNSHRHAGPDLYRWRLRRCVRYAGGRLV